MALSTEDQIAQLLSEGLEHYGNGEEARAIACWVRVLELDPDHEEASDYLHSAKRGIQAEPGSKGAQEAAREIIKDAKRLVREDDLEGAFSLLRSGLTSANTSLEIEALVDLTRVRLLERYREHIGDLTAIPAQPAGGKLEALTNYNLPPNAGFILSLVDGATSIRDLITLSGMDAFDALRTLGGLLDAGIVELRS